jgi:acetyltransferase-like isoleucine patch superfamily enzyme
MNKVQKAFHRVFRILSGKKGVYCGYKKGNYFGKYLFLHENASIGAYNYIGNGTMMSNAKVGNYCSIAPYVKLGQTEHDLKCVSTSTHIFGPKHGITYFTGDIAPTVIENDVWLAANVVVKQGVTVHTGAVVGAGAVVTKDIPPYAIAVGVPAKVIGYRFCDRIIDNLLQSQWWQLPPMKAREVCHKLQKEIDLNEN